MIEKYLIISSFDLLKPQTGLMLKYNILDPITSASTTTSPSIRTEPRYRTDTTVMMSRDFTPTNVDGKIPLGVVAVAMLVSNK